jgi:hypothetical protein
MHDGEQLIATIRKSDHLELRITRVRFKTCFREWYRDRATGEMLPGQDGLEFPVAVAGEIIAALAKACA